MRNRKEERIGKKEIRKEEKEKKEKERIPREKDLDQMRKKSFGENKKGDEPTDRPANWDTPSRPGVRK